MNAFCMMNDGRDGMGWDGSGCVGGGGGEWS